MIINKTKKTEKNSSIEQKALKKASEGKFEDNPKLVKLCLYFVIVNQGQSSIICKLLQNNGASCCFIQSGEGTVSSDVANILGLSHNGKDIIISIVSKEYIPDIDTVLKAQFKTSKKNKGVAFTIDLNTLMGVRIYSFLVHDI